METKAQQQWLTTRLKAATPGCSLLTDSLDPAGAPLPGIGDADGEKSSPPAESAEDPMPGIAGTGAPDCQMR